MSHPVCVRSSVQQGAMAQLPGGVFLAYAILHIRHGGGDKRVAKRVLSSCATPAKPAK
ncbi:MAG: hypothetical protein IPH35_18330 [Rhodoferax sp.]|nr:hypothetical protein [Rhodoferax sp.]